MHLIISLFSYPSFQSIVQWAIHHSYPLILVGMILEGPVLIAATSFAASLGYFDLSIIFVLAMLGDLIGDGACYLIGYFSRTAFLNKFGHYVGATPSRMAQIKKLLERHPIKILAAIKIAPLTPVPGLIVAGSSHMSPRKFIASIFIIILPKVVFFMILGYFFGGVYEYLRIYLSGIYTVVLIGAAVVVVYYLYRAISERVAEELEK